MQSRNFSQLQHTKQLPYMLYALSRRLRRLCSRIRWLAWRRPRPKLIIRRLHKTPKGSNVSQPKSACVQRPIRLATFNAALFSLAPAIPKDECMTPVQENNDFDAKIDDLLNPTNAHPKGILKQSPSHPTFSMSPKDEDRLIKLKPKVSINLPENEISLSQNKLLLDTTEDSSFSFNNNTIAPMRSPICFPASIANWFTDSGLYRSRTVFDVIKDVGADILALQDVKAEEEMDMKPLSDLAHALGMYYVFAESWAPEYGNAVLSKWPIKKWKVQRIHDDNDFRNVIKATIDIPLAGELNVYCTQLDHLDENWRMKQINAIFQSNDQQPHILAGGLNSLDSSDYSPERWNHIMKYYEELGKPTPRVEVTDFLKGKAYTDAKNFPGECEPVVMIAKGQNVQGTCKYGTRVDYIMGSQGLPYTFVPGSYSVLSSKGTSDHHMVKVDIMRGSDGVQKSRTGKKKLKQQVMRLTTCSSRGIWNVYS